MWEKSVINDSRKRKTDISDLRGFLVKLDMDGGVIGHTLNTMVCIEVLMHCDLENGSSSLPMKMERSSAILIMTHGEKKLAGS
jgi:hypothetical protein